MSATGQQTTRTLGELVARSRRLGADRTICNWGGGNTSAKTMETDFRGRPTPTLWVKGSGADLAACTAANFAGLRLDDVLPLMERDELPDAEMVAYLGHCALAPNGPRPSIETLLHAFLPAAHVNHTHPDAIIALCCADNGEQLMRRIWGKRAVWVPYRRPGFALAKAVARAVRENPDAKAVLLAKHGLVTWGESSDACEASTMRVIAEAADYLARHGADEPFGALVQPPLPAEERRALLARVLPAVRGACAGERPVILRYDDSADVLDFVGRARMPELARIGAACPDHLVHTKRVPLVVGAHRDAPHGEWTADTLLESILDGIARYREDYAAYYARNSTGEFAQYAMDNPAPRVILIPGIGMVTTGPDAARADLSAALYHRAIAVMRGAASVGAFTSLTEEESFAVEYWPLERYKLTLAPPPREFSGRVAFITGGAGGIGGAAAERLARDGAHVVIADFNAEAGNRRAEELATHHGAGRALAVRVDVTNEAQVKAAFDATALAYGGVDIVISNAGIASSAPIEETTLAEWERNIGVLATGYFLVSRAAFRMWKAQGTGGALVFVASKNSMAAGKNAAAYSAAKAAELHLARCLAEEGGAAGIRVNTICPDAVLQGSTIWSSAWREERARAYNIAPEQLEEFYRQRTTLKVNVLPEDIAEAVAFFASPRAAKTTGGVLTVDGGVATAYVR
jgi:rhamnulose-1-phosphate aldolase/alcohol dehydrogenase